MLIRIACEGNVVLNICLYHFLSIRTVSSHFPIIATMSRDTAYTTQWVLDNSTPRDIDQIETNTQQPTMFQSIQTSISSRITRLGFSQLPSMTNEGQLNTSSSAVSANSDASNTISRPSTPLTEVADQQLMVTLARTEAEWDRVHAAMISLQCAINRQQKSSDEAEKLLFEACQHILHAVSPVLDRNEQRTEDLRRLLPAAAPKTQGLPSKITATLLVWNTMYFLPWTVAGIEKIAQYEKRNHTLQRAFRKLADTLSTIGVVQVASWSLLTPLLASVVYLLNELSTGLSCGRQEIENRRHLQSINSQDCMKRNSITAFS